jgi:hypothetical protein
MSFNGYEHPPSYPGRMGANISLEEHRIPASCRSVRASKGSGESPGDPWNDLPDFLRDALPNRDSIGRAEIEMEVEQLSFVLWQARQQFMQSLPESQQTASPRLGHESHRFTRGRIL